MPETFVTEVQVLRRIAIPKTTYEILKLNHGDKVRVTIDKAE
jgi:bifunctional DNA-binding transcriptional regulator/antitoxin component of YhaV-PrlF toxin-antitoxin module